MTLYYIKTKRNRELFKVNGRTITGGNTFNHLKNKIYDLKPLKVTTNFFKGRPDGKRIAFKMKGIVPTYGYKLEDTISPSIKEKLYGTC
jgi:hypothetical protein